MTFLLYFPYFTAMYFYQATFQCCPKGSPLCKPCPMASPLPATGMLCANPAHRLPARFARECCLPVHNRVSKFCSVWRASPARSREPPKLNLLWRLCKWQIRQLRQSLLGFQSAGSCAQSISSVPRSPCCCLLFLH